MKAPRQWINTDQRRTIRDLTWLTAYACYHSLRQKAKTDNLLTKVPRQWINT